MAAPGKELRGVAISHLDESELEGADKELLSRLGERVTALTGIPVHSNELRPVLKFDNPSAAAGSSAVECGEVFECGMHLDVNGGYHHRACTVILYLNHCEGGYTAFPCAGNERSRELGTLLAERGHTHTSNSAVHNDGLEAHALELHKLAATASDAVRVQPQTGSAVLFFSLLGQAECELDQSEGELHSSELKAPPADPLTWHAGAAVDGAIGKWTVQFFKEVPAEHRKAGVEAMYVTQLRERLKGAACSPSQHVDILEELD
eukprot:gnl/MRDRNA2_/MRDRNA2_396263_c0_seq1.p1 gnl/MRDRNA2_/MRDRNA2_396263_c0~~gnl/MRDRNA2_/MRDRNA2_396263_c0_seq1.p1  ORF type:complete len:299 (+),score=44.31 gnl/MRDRNA2_/MRDRNA2_396263_c0_seq1:111-899(+)